MNKLDPITKEEFEEQYARNSSMTVERLRELGQSPMPCGCDYELCRGWQMASKEWAKHGL